VDFALNTIEQELVGKAKRLAKEFLISARKYDEAGEFPRANMDRLREEGLLALTVPVEYGGYGMWDGSKYLGFYLVLETIAAACGSTGQLLQVHCHCVSNIASLANKEQKERILRAVVQNGALVGSAGDATREIAAGRAELRPVKGGFRLTSRQRFGSLSGDCDYLMVFAAPEGARTFGESVILCVPRDTPGLVWEDTWSDAMGMRATVSGTTILNDVFVPWENVIGKPGDFVRDPRGWTLAYGSSYLGTAQGAFDFVRQYVAKKPELLEDDVVTSAIADMDTAIQAARTSLWYACWLWEEENYVDAELASMKFASSAKQTVAMVTSKAFEVCGASAAFRNYPLERYWRDSRMFTLHTRESSNARLIAKAAVSGDFHAKQWFAESADQLSWEQYGVTPESRKTADVA
jgi:alkylation response protein AidB-like acyl-CoA dehydrogenase